MLPCVLYKFFSDLCDLIVSEYLLTYSMVQSPSWEVNWFAASQEISRNPKVHYCSYERSPPFSILGQPNPVHIPTSHILEIHPNIIHPSTPRFPQWSPSLRVLHQYPIHPLSSPIRATCPAHLKVIVLLMKIQGLFCVKCEEHLKKSLCEICFSKFLILYAYILLYNRSATSFFVGKSGFESEFVMIFSASL